MHLWQEATGFSRALETHSKLDAMVSQLSQSQPSSEPLLSTGKKPTSEWSGHFGYMEIK